MWDGREPGSAAAFAARRRVAGESRRACTLRGGAQPTRAREKLPEAAYWQGVPRLRQSPLSQTNIVPDLQTVEALATVDPSSMHVFAAGGGTTRGASPATHAVSRLIHLPSLQRYFIPLWQLAEPAAYCVPFSVQSLELTLSPVGQVTANDFHLPSSQRYWMPDWHVVDPSEKSVPLKLQLSLAIAALAIPNTNPVTKPTFQLTMSHLLHWMSRVGAHSVPGRQTTPNGKRLVLSSL